jgi:hypothetical protein
VAVSATSSVLICLALSVSLPEAELTFDTRVVQR